MDSLLEIPLNIQTEYISQINRILVDRFYSSNRAILAKSPISNSSQYKDFCSNCEHNVYSLHEPIKGTSRKNEVAFQLTLSGKNGSLGYQTELYKLKKI